ncbi:hypothetical protein DSM43518_02305 [Mycobacterium marinum]|nr:hypothetical protein DSM43518_02305 [Mycobacterium marinum]
MPTPQRVESHAQAIPVADIVIKHSHRRSLDPRRAHVIANNRRFRGIEDSDRGGEHQLRYMVVNRENHWTAAALDARAAIAARMRYASPWPKQVQPLLCVDRQRLRHTTVNRWKALRAQCDPDRLGLKEAGCVGRRLW